MYNDTLTRLTRALEAQQRYYTNLFTPQRPTDDCVKYTSLGALHREAMALNARLAQLEQQLGYKAALDLPSGGSTTGDTATSSDTGTGDNPSGHGASIGGDSSTGGGDHFNPNQPRVPAGSPDGGQWTDAGETLKDGEGKNIIDPNTGKPYPLPPGLDIWKNVAQGRHATALHMYNWFSHYGNMEYQRSTGTFDGSLRNVTNYNYGVVSAAAGYPLSHALFFAGKYNLNVGRIHGGETNLGILPDAVANISQGWYDYFLKWND